MVGVVALAAAAFAGGAYAATQSNTNPRQAFLDDVAKRLNVSPAQLNAAFKAAFLDRLDAAVKAGVITQAQANQLKQRLTQGAPVPFFFGAPRGPGVPHLFGGPRGFGLHAGGGSTTLGAAASYLGLSRAQLFNDLRQGKTLAQVAKSRGKSVAGLQQAIAAAMKARLDKAVADGRITTAEESQILSRLSSRIANRLNRPLLRFAPRLRAVPPGEGPWGSGSPPGPAVLAPPAVPPPGASLPPGAPLPPPAA